MTVTVIGTGVGWVFGGAGWEGGGLGGGGGGRGLNSCFVYSYRLGIKTVTTLVLGRLATSSWLLCK